MARSSCETPTRTRGSLAPASPPSDADDDDGEARTSSGRRRAGAEIPEEEVVGAIAPRESRPGVEEAAATGASFFSLGAEKFGRGWGQTKRAVFLGPKRVAGAVRDGTRQVKVLGTGVAPTSCERDRPSNSEEPRGADACLEVFAEAGGEDAGPVLEDDASSTTLRS